MLMPRRIKLLLAATLAASSLTLVIAAYSSSGAITESYAARPTLKSKILRRKDRLKDKPNAYEVALLRRQATVQEERQVEDAVPKHVPLKIKLKREKEVKFKDLNNPDWMRDFELQVTNTSNKPIYFLELWLELPDTKSESGYPLMVPLRYGRAAFVDFDTRAIRDDVPIGPGETHTFTVEEKYLRGWQRGKARTRISDPRKVKFVFVQLSFGDGSGFNGTGAEAYPYNRKLSSSAYCREGGEQIARMPSIRSGPFRSSYADRWSESTPALIMPANFFLVDAKYRPRKSAAPDLNCPGTNCFFAKPSTYICSCKSDARTYELVGSGDPNGNCSRSQRDDSWCDFDVGCTEWVLTPCILPTPTPTPTPTPSPSPTPTPTPTPCPDGSFNPNPDGSCPIYSNKINGCCVCQERNTDCERFGQGTWYEGTPYCVWNEADCDCVNIDGKCSENPRPLATPNPTPTPGGGGGGDQPPQQPCTHYYWVEYRSYDGGESWQEVDRWYAGCW